MTVFNEREETHMRTIILVMLGAALLLSGCKKDNKETANAGDAMDGYNGKGGKDGNGSGDADGAGNGKNAGAGKEFATGDMRDLLLTLERVHFSMDGATLTEESKVALSEAAVKLQANPSVSLHVDGHTDNRGTDEYNMSLGDRRARVVVKYLTDSGVEAARLNVVSFGEEMPLEEGSGDVALAKNRRVDFRLMKGDIQLVLEEGTLVDDAGAPIQ